MGMDNIFMHDAVPTWSGFLYQGRIAVYLAVRKINELREAGNESEIKKYALEMEKCEDIAVVYMDGNNKKYHSIHQVKNEKGCKLASYKDPLIQLMLEKGVCRKNNYGTPAAYLHISKEINYESESMNGHALECLKNWKADILKFYNDLSVTYDSFVGNEVTLKRLLDLMKNNTKTIGINREEYKKKYSELKKMCNDALEDIGSDNFRNEQMIKYTLGDFINYLDRKLYVTQVSEEVEIYEYETGKSYCTGSDVFTAIVGQVKRYKGESCGFIDEQFKYIADIMINFIESKILERHKCMQEKKDASYEIMLSEFKKMLDGTVENYEKEANILALNRIYNDHLESYCNACQRKNRDVCQSEICKLQQAEYRKGSLEKNEFIKFCYNLNPECDKQIFDRECLGYLLIKDGMMESVFPIIKEVAQKNLIEREDKIHIKVKNKNKVAYVTAISSIDEFQTVENIAKAMEKNQGLVETIFEADQLITTRLKENSDVWDSSCIKVRPDDIDEVEINHNENSIFVPKRPEFIKATEVIENMERESVYEQLDILSNKKKKTCYLKKLESEREEKAGEIEGLNAAIQKCNKESNVVYQRLFTDKDIFWDKESVKFDDITYTNAKKELDNLIYFAEHKTECANFLFNIPYQNLIKDFNGDKNISYTQYPLEYSYRFIGLVKQVEVLEEKYQREKKAQLILKNIQEKQYEDLNWLFIQEEKLLEDDSITIIKQQLGVISNLRKAQGILQNAMTALGQSRENLVKNANAAMEAGGISDKQCPLCGAPYSDRDELDSKIKEETELLSDISDDSVIIIQDIRNQIYNNYLKKVEKTIQEILADVVTEEMYQSLQDAKKYGSQILEVERILEKIGVGLNRKDARFENIQQFPYMGADLAKRVSFRTDYKYVICGNYVVLYKIRDEYVEIYRVMNRYQDITKIF